MRSIPLLSLLLSLLAAAPAFAATALTLKPAALVTGARVTLADVAADAQPGMDKIDLGAAPLPGMSTRLSRSQVERVLRTRALPYRLANDGAAVVTIDRRAQAWDQSALVQLAQDHLRAHLAASGARIELELATPLADLPLPAGVPSFKPRALTATSPQRRMTVWVDIAVDGAFARTVALPFQVRAMAPVMTAVRDLAPGAQPDCTALQPRETDLTTLPGAAVADCAAVTGRLKRALAQGTPLLKSHLQAELAVTQGDSIAMQLRDGAIVIESRATALSDGSIGQRIDVRPSGASNTVRAEVIGPALVRIN